MSHSDLAPTLRFSSPRPTPMSRPALILLFIVLAVGTFTNAGGQQAPTPSAGAALNSVLVPSDAERVATAYDTRSHDYDLVHQRIELSAINWDSTSFAGRVTTVLVARRPGLDSVTLDAGSKLDVSRAATPQGGGLRTSRSGDTLVVHLGHSAAMGDTVRFTLEYRAHIQNGRGLTFIQPEGRSHRPQQVWSQGEAQDNHYWFPTYDFPDDKMTWEVVATVPTRYTVVSNGRLVSDTRMGNGLHSVHWSQDAPSATYLVSIVIAPLKNRL